MRLPEHPALLAVLKLPALLYGGASRIRNRYYDNDGVARRVAAPVISVGNLTVGGTGKTSVVAWMAGRLREAGRNPAVLSRGYRGAAGRGPLVVSKGAGALVPASTSGDEAHLLARKLPGVPILVGSDRVSSARMAIDMGADVLVLDDGFQHRRLGRDLDIVLVDAGSPFGNYHLLPAGSLREPISGLARADVVLITRSRPDEPFVVIDRVVRRHNPDCPILRAATERAGFVDPEGTPVDAPRRVVAFCGIGNPDGFRSDLESENVEIAAFRAFGDHHPYTPADWGELIEAARDLDAILVTTEKDLPRLSTYLGGPDPVRVCALSVEIRVHERDRLMTLVHRAITRAGA